MLIKNSDLIGKPLDYAVAKAQGWVYWDRCWWSLKPSGERDYRMTSREGYSPSTNWLHGGKILQQLMLDGMKVEAVSRHYQNNLPNFKATFDDWSTTYRADTPLIAAMLCYVASVYGEEVDIPEELL